MQEKLMNTAEAARYLNMSQFTLRDWRKYHESRLPFVKMGKAKTTGVRVMYRQQDLDEFLKNNVKGKSLDEVWANTISEKDAVSLEQRVARLESLLQRVVDLLEQRN